MKLSLAEPKYLKDSISIISELVNEGKFKITKDAIELIAMDPANVAMIVFRLLSSSFVEYDIKEEVEIGVNLGSMKQVLRRAKSSDTLILGLEENKLVMQLRGSTTRTFKLPLIDLDSSSSKIPSLDFPLLIETNSDLLNDSIEDVGIVGDSVNFVVENKKFLISSKGDLSNAEVIIKEGDETKITVDTQDTIRAKYSIEYLKKMIGGSKLSGDGKVIIQFHKDYPLKLEYKTLNKVQLSFILAPRVEND